MMKITLSQKLKNDVQNGYVKAIDVIQFLKNTTNLIFPDKPIENTSLKDLKFDNKNVSKAIFDKIDGVLILEF